MKQVLISRGAASVEDVPAPMVEPGTVIVRVQSSCISVGTEMSGVRASGLPLWKRAMQRPEQVAKLVRTAAQQGVRRTWSMVEGKLATGQATGYSAAGVVVEVGEGVTDLLAGDRVACAGAQFAFHAEVIRVPRNLVVPVPDAVSWSDASTVTLGAIALQGVRRAHPTLGETFVVIGLGILGQLTVQLLKANGCRTIGVDLNRDRLHLATELGLDAAVHPDDVADVEHVARLTDGIGADGVIIAAATPSDAVVSTAFRMCRRKGRVVLVGDVGLNLDRADFYQKEIDFLSSSSYGPGRYDRNYEERGLDYPTAYVRWTENRNMAEYLRLVAEGRVAVGPLVSATYPVGEADAAYATLREHAGRHLMVLLSYPEAATGAEPFGRAVSLRAASPARSGRLRLAVIGAGGFAKGMHLPNVQALGELFELRTVVSRTGHNAVATARQFGAARAATDAAEATDDPEIDAVLIATRHDTHAALALAALRAGKHVLLEKPLALEADELAEIVRFYEETGGAKPLLLTGFNRRFSPFARRLAELTAARSNPMILNYRMNAGHIPRDHWVHGPEGGGRNVGEACHIYDLFTFLTGARVEKVSAQALRPSSAHYGRDDNFVATMSFADGSVATLTYTALGAKEHPKERLEVYVDGRVLLLDDYRSLTVVGARAKGVETPVQDKGQKEELVAFASAVREGGEWPIPLWQQVQATEISFEVERWLRT